MSNIGKFSNKELDDAWWRRELVRFNSDAKQWIRGKYPTLQHYHQDIVGETVLQLTNHLSKRPKNFPHAWFEVCDPDEEEIWRFRALAFTILKRRVTDRFREDFRQRECELPIAIDSYSGEELESLSEGLDLSDALDLRRTVNALLILLAKMPTSDCLLMESMALGTHDGPMNANERQRVSRLRRQLLNELRTMLGEDPVELLKRLRGD